MAQNTSGAGLLERLRSTPFFSGRLGAIASRQ
jgi:hypothetical protein